MLPIRLHTRAEFYGPPCIYHLGEYLILNLETPAHHCSRDCPNFASKAAPCPLAPVLEHMSNHRTSQNSRWAGSKWILVRQAAVRRRSVKRFLGPLEKTRKNVAQTRPQVVATHAVTLTRNERLQEDRLNSVGEQPPATTAVVQVSS